MRIIGSVEELKELGAGLSEDAAGLRVAIDTETTRIDPKRGFSPFYGVRAALIQLSWDDPHVPEGHGYDVAIPIRMKPGVRGWPELPKGNKAESKAIRAAWREAHKLWLEDGDATHLQAVEGVEVDVEPVTNLPVEAVVEVLNQLTRAGVVWVLKNLKFDWLMLMADGVEIAPLEQIEDVEVQSHLSEQNPWQQGRRVSHKLQDLAQRHLGRDPDAADALGDWFEGMRVGQDMRDYSAVPISIAAEYGCQDTRDTLDLHGFFCRLIEEMDRSSAKGKSLQGLYREEVELLVNLVARTITDGCGVDQARADELLARYEKIRSIHEGQLKELTGRDIDWASPDKVASYLFDSPDDDGLGLKVPEFAVTDTGKRSTSKAVLEELDVPVTQELLKWRAADTFVGTFLEPVARFNIGGFVHSDFWIANVRTGRLSCSHPNFQNQPKDEDIRSIFVPRPGYVFLDFDYDQIEMRLAAHYAARVIEGFPEFSYQSYWNGKPSRYVTSRQREAVMARRFREEPDFDPHMIMTDLSGLPRKREHVGETTSKEVNFAILYGVGLRGMQRNYGWEYAKAKKIKGIWRKAYPEIVHLQHFMTMVLLDRGWLANEFGRRYYVDADKAYLALNYVIQGCAGDLMKRAMNRIYRLLRRLEEEFEGPRPVYLTNTVHDELLFEVREDLLTPGLARRIRAEMVDWKREDGSDKFAVPITTGCEVSESGWGSLQEYSLDGEPD